MYCKKCGHRNDNSSSFCSSCGSDLREPSSSGIGFRGKNTSQDRGRSYRDSDSGYDRDYEFYRDNEESPYENGYNTRNFSSNHGNTPIKIILGIIVAVLVLGGGYFGFRVHSIKKLEKQAATYYEVGDYENAKIAYQKLVDKTDKQEYIDKLKETKLLIESEEDIKKVNEYITSGMNYEALTLLKRLEEETPQLSKKVNSKISDLMPSIKKDLQAYIDTQDYKGAIANADLYLKLLPGDASIEAIKSQALSASESKEKAEKIKEEREKIAAEDRAAAIQKASQVQTLSSKLLCTYQTVHSSEANVRSGPGFGYGIIGNLNKGDSVYVYSTMPASGRVWCNIGGGGWISSRTLGYN